jgi:hypothetical protein
VWPGGGRFQAGRRHVREARRLSDADDTTGRGGFGDPFEFDAAVERVNTPIWREARWPLEWLRLRLSPVYCGRGVPRGSGEPVLVIPGFLSSDLIMLEMHRWLFRIGYRPHFSQISFNTDCPNETARALVARVQAIREKSGKKVRLVGHSLGGMLAHSLVQQVPEAIDRCVTMGSPFRDLVRAHPAVVGLWDDLKRAKGNLVGRNLRASCGTGHCMCPFVKNILDPEPREVPQYAIYSRTDGVAHWESCMGDDPARNDEVDCTHVGMAFHPGVYRVLAERLAEPAQHTG